MKIKKLYNYILKNGGATLSLNNNLVEYESGFQVAFKPYEKIAHIENLKSFKKSFRAYKKQVKKQIKKTLNIGLWLENNNLYFDISKNINFLTNALMIAESNEQKSIFKWEDKTCIYLENEK